MTNREFDTLAYTLEQYDSNIPSMSFSASTYGEAHKWQGELRAKLIELMGGFPSERCDLKAETLEVKEFEDYTRESVVFQSRENMSVFAYMLIPKIQMRKKLPAILCFHGHGRGVDDIVGMQADGSMREKLGGYQMDFALQCVRHGYVALAVEQFGFGRRRDEAAKRSGPGVSSCQPASGAALLLGQTMIGWRVYDGIRALDYLETRPEVDARRIGAMGISGGGTTSFHLAAVDQRVSAAVVSGYFNTFRDSIMSISHCIDNYIPGILRYAEMYDLAGLIAPRALFVESGTKDSIFPYRATLRSFDKAKAIYQVFGAEDQIGIEVFEGEHSFHGVGAFRFLEKHLKRAA